MNRLLVDYGIREEQSDIRAHVSVVGRCVYVYPTRFAIEALASGNYRSAPARTGGLVTAMGCLVPPGEIKLCKRIAIPADVLAKAGFDEGDSTSVKGEKALRAVRWLLRAGLFPLWAEPVVIDDLDMQTEGMDIVVQMRARIQVKCDWRAGEGKGCTGNLYIQTQECNPYALF